MGRILGEGLGLQMTGLLVMLARVFDALLTSMTRSYGIAFLLITPMMKTTGAALLFTTLVLTGGFAIIACGTLVNVRNFGILAAFATVTAFLADLLVSPALMALATRGVHTKSPSSSDRSLIW